MNVLELREHDRRLLDIPDGIPSVGFEVPPAIQQPRRDRRLESALAFDRARDPNFGNGLPIVRLARFGPERIVETGDRGPSGHTVHEPHQGRRNAMYSPE